MVRPPPKPIALTSLKGVLRDRGLSEWARLLCIELMRQGGRRKVPALAASLDTNLDTIWRAAKELRRRDIAYLPDTDTVTLIEGHPLRTALGRSGSKLKKQLEELCDGVDLANVKADLQEAQAALADIKAQIASNKDLFRHHQFPDRTKALKELEAEIAAAQRRLGGVTARTGKALTAAEEAESKAAQARSTWAKLAEKKSTVDKAKAWDAQQQALKGAR